MKIPWLSLLTVSFLIMSMAALLYFFDNRPPQDLIRPDTFQMNQTGSADRSVNSLSRTETAEAYELTYGWRDFKRKMHSVTFSLSKQQLAAAEEEFGYNPEQLRIYLEESLVRMNNEMISHLEKFASQQLLASGYSQYISMDKVSPQDFSLRLSAPSAISKEVKAEFDRITQEIKREQEAYLRQIEKEQEKIRREFLEQRGFRFEGDSMSVNYSLVVINNRPRVKHIMDALRKEFGKGSLRQFLARTLAFIQGIPYGLPPLREEEKIILEFWVPPKVLIHNFGDCDSKGVTFAALWTNFKKYPFLLIKIPKHFFIGVAIPSLSGEGFAINGIRYTLCEVTGPELIPPGMITQYSLLYLQGGNYRYELIN